MESGYLWLTVAIIFNILAQFLLKVGSQKNTLDSTELIPKIINIITNPLFIAALLFYGLAFIAYFLSLSKIELTKAYPLVSISVMIVIFFGSVFFLSENANFTKILGVILCILGIILIYVRG